MLRWNALAVVRLPSVLLALAVASTAMAQSPAAIDCQTTIGRETRRLASESLEVLVDCNAAVVDGGQCDPTDRDARIARAEARFERRVQAACADVALTELGFPGQCADPTGGTFSADDLIACLEAAVRSGLGAALDALFPALAPQTGEAAQCQKTLANHGARFFEGKLRARTRCFELTVKGTLEGADCGAEVPPGTGNAKTDKTIAKFARRLTDKVGRACRGVDLTALGFPGACATQRGEDFDAAQLSACIHDQVEAIVDALVALAFARGPVATPTPSTVPSPSPSVSPSASVGPSPSPIGCILPSPFPQVVSLVTKPGVDLDTGWTGISHDLRGVDNAPLTAARLTDCDVNPQSPSCGRCSLQGPITFPGEQKNCFCFNTTLRDASSFTVCDPESTSSCTGGEICQCFYGPPLPISSGAVPVCVVNLYDGPVTGTANVADAGPGAGTTEALIRLQSLVHNGLTVDRPCPVCQGDTTQGDGVANGTCVGGPRNGSACDVAGTHPFFGPVSFTCPPPASADVGDLSIVFDPATTSATMLGTGPFCTAFGRTDLKCFCDTCATNAAEPCNSNADCPGGAECGGRRCIGGNADGTPCTDASECEPEGVCDRPGEPTSPNGCSNGVCVADPNDPDNPNEGRCQNGPNDNLCSIETFRGCLASADCNPPPTGNCGNCLPNQTCTVKRRQCFLDPIVRTGMPGTQMAVLAATFCIAPTRSPAVNSVSGLPGPGALLLPTRVFRATALCGNGTLDGGEQCDPAAAGGVCPGACQPDCTCGPFCGDHIINQPSEQCDAPAQGSCTAGCEANCTCTPVCGNGIREGSEKCDMDDDTACPGLCQSNCTCAPFCGDNHVDPGEQCDGTGSTACPPNACKADCTCGPFCGDANIDPGEQCDSTMTGTCPGTCEADCTCSPVCGNNVREGSELCDGSDATACPGQCLGDCRCGPVVGHVSFVARPGSDLDNGWTGQSHNGTVQAGATISGEIAACDGVSDFECTFLSNVGSFCSGDPSRACTSNSQCLSGQHCVISIYGAPQPLSSGGVPVCLVSRFAEDVTGTYNLMTGAASLRIPLNTLVHFSQNVSQPCPVCNCGKANLQDCQIGESGMCEGFGATPGECVIEATGPFGPTTNDCPPLPAANVSGGGVRAFYDPATTGMVSFAATLPCTAQGHENEKCWCPGELRPSACQNACDGGDRDAQACVSDVECPNAPAGACQPLCRQILNAPVGEGRCVAGPADRRCANAEEIGCVTNANCPGTTGPCTVGLRRCFLDPIERQGTAGTATDVLASAICVAATGAPAIDTNTGLPGPSALRLFNTVVTDFCGNGVVTFPEQCDVGADGACPGKCQADCSCGATCGNGTIEFGEQCEATSDAACPGQCVAQGSAGECTCPPVCGDGFVGPGEECDPGGAGGTPAPSDAACPGRCDTSTCQCPPTECGNGVLEPGETCELPANGCGPLQQCTGCTACAP